MGDRGAERPLGRALGIDVLRTMGAEGSEASTLAEGEIRVGAPKLRAVDTSAAGDCFIGFLASALDRGAPLKTAMTRATQAAALACMRLGSQSSIPWAAEVDAAAAPPAPK